MGVSALGLLVLDEREDDGATDSAVLVGETGASVGSSTTGTSDGADPDTDPDG